jgi:hypothetical protein
VGSKEDCPEALAQRKEWPSGDCGEKKEQSSSNHGLLSSDISLSLFLSLFYSIYLSSIYLIYYLSLYLLFITYLLSSYLPTHLHALPGVHLIIF